MSAALKMGYAVGLGIGVTVALVSTSIWYFSKKRYQPPKTWRRVGTIENINIFPVKSCEALKLKGDEEITCDNLGLSFQGCRDRALMLINETGNMITARNFPRIEQVVSELLGPSKIKFTASGMTEIVLDLTTLQSKESEEIRTAVCSTNIKVYLCGEEYDKWFSEVILRDSFGLRLVHYPMVRPVKTINSLMLQEPHITNDDREINSTTTMLINLASVDEVTRHMERTVSPQQFRGSFELKMDEHEPYAEDYWNWVKIGSVIFRKVAPCRRRVFPNVSTEVPGTHMQNTLKRLRSFEGYPSPIFGIHLNICQPGAIKVNDVVYVEEYLFSSTKFQNLN